MNNKIGIPSLIKWTGSKRSQANEINKYFPIYKTYYEPFLGSGALLYLNTQRKAIASDVYQPLINLWNLIKNNPKQVIDTYNNDWKLLQSYFPNYFYKIRDRYNSEKRPLDLLFLSRTCVSGIIRFNQNGDFNNSLHLTRRGMKPPQFERIVNDWTLKIKDVNFVCSDYKQIFSKTKKGDFVYLDPPYAGSKNRYISNLDVNEFFKQLDILNLKDVKYALSFDGFRDEKDLRFNVPKSIFKRCVILHTGHSAVKNVLSKQKNLVRESLYLNY